MQANLNHERSPEMVEPVSPGAFILKELAGELRWIENKDQALEKRILVEARRIEDRYFSQRRTSEQRREAHKTRAESPCTNGEHMVEEWTDSGKVEDLNYRLLSKRRRRGHPKYEASVINYNNLKVFNSGYMSCTKENKEGVVEEWTTNWKPPMGATKPTKTPTTIRR